MSHVHSRIFDEFRLLDSKNRPVRDVFFSDHALWLEYPGCAIQRTDFPLPPGMRTDGILKPGFYLSIILEGSGEGGPLKGEGRQQYGENELIAMVLREPTRCGSAGCRGAHMRAIVIEPTDQSKPDPKLLQATVRAHAWLNDLTSGRYHSVEARAEDVKLHPKIIRQQLRLAFLAPSITEGATTGESGNTASLGTIPKTLPLSCFKQQKTRGE